MESESGYFCEHVSKRLNEQHVRSRRTSLSVRALVFSTSKRFGSSMVLLKICAPLSMDVKMSFTQVE